jgi:hypothetical protein
MMIHSKSLLVCAFMEAAVLVKPLRLLSVMVMMESGFVLICARDMPKTLSNINYFYLLSVLITRKARF